MELRTTHAHNVGSIESGRQEVKKRFSDSKVQLMGLGSIFDYHTPDPEKLRKDIEATKDRSCWRRTSARPVSRSPNGLPKEVPVERTRPRIGRALAESGDFPETTARSSASSGPRPRQLVPPLHQDLLDTANRPNVGACWTCNASDLEGGELGQKVKEREEKILSVHMTDLFQEAYPFPLLNGLNGIHFQGFCLAEVPVSTGPVRVMKSYRAP